MTTLAEFKRIFNQKRMQTLLRDALRSRENRPCPHELALMCDNHNLFVRICRREISNRILQLGKKLAHVLEIATQNFGLLHKIISDDNFINELLTIFNDEESETTLMLFKEKELWQLAKKYLIKHSPNNRTHDNELTEYLVFFYAHIVSTYIDYEKELNLQKIKEWEASVDDLNDRRKLIQIGADARFFKNILDLFSRNDLNRLAALARKVVAHLPPVHFTRQVHPLAYDELDYWRNIMDAFKSERAREYSKIRKTLRELIGRNLMYIFPLVLSIYCGVREFFTSSGRSQLKAMFPRMDSRSELISFIKTTMLSRFSEEDIKLLFNIIEASISEIDKEGNKKERTSYIPSLTLPPAHERIKAELVRRGKTGAELFAEIVLPLLNRKTKTECDLNEVDQDYNVVELKRRGGKTIGFLYPHNHLFVNASTAQRMSRPPVPLFIQIQQLRQPPALTEELIIMNFSGFYRRLKNKQMERKLGRELGIYK